MRLKITETIHKYRAGQIEIKSGIFHASFFYLFKEARRKMDAHISGSIGQKLTCSIIGSFRKYYSEIVALIEAFEAYHIHVLSPKRSDIINPQEHFVRLKTDNPQYEPVEIQLIALHRILRSNFVYVFCPTGYIGRTTCYEIGRIHERGVPLYFSECPEDLPIAISASAIIKPERFLSFLAQYRSLPAILATEISEYAGELLIRLRQGEYVE